MRISKRNLAGKGQSEKRECTCNSLTWQGAHTFTLADEVRYRLSGDQRVRGVERLAILNLRGVYSSNARAKCAACLPQSSRL